MRKRWTISKQIERILDQNEQDTARARQELKQDCFIRAKAAAYILQSHPEVIPIRREMKKIARLSLQSGRTAFL